MTRPLRPGTAAATIALALVAGAVTAVSAPRAAMPQSLDTMRIAPPLDVLRVPSDPEPAAVPAVSPSAVPTVRATASTAPAASPTAARPRPSATLAATTSGPAAPAVDRQTGSWTHTYDGTTLRLAMHPARPRAGELVTFVVDMSRDDADCCGAQLYFGDGRSATAEQDRQCDARGGTTTGRSTFVFHHGYRSAGTYTPWVHVMAGCGRNPLWFTYQPTFEVSAGPPRSNGPVAPWVSLGEAVGDDAQDQWFAGRVEEHDGYVARWTWDFGDGTTVEQQNAEPCRMPGDGGWTESAAAPRASHRFAMPGTYTVRLTAVSTGCDGRDPQATTASFTWTVPAQ